MNPRPFVFALVCAALVAVSVAVAAAVPSASSQGTEVLGARVVASSTTTTSPTASTSPTTTTSTSNSSTTTTTTTTTTLPASLAGVTLEPGPLAAPRPAAPVTLTETTPALDHVPTTDKVIFLGIDDGLVRDPALLPLLRKERIPLTLFLVDQQARDGADFFRQMQTLGATIQDHTMTHPEMPKLGWSDQHHQICDEIPDLTSLYGTRPTLFRPPYGEWNETTRSVAAGCGLHALILWRGATNDGRLDIITGHFNPGDIILMHFRTDLIENLQLVLARARAEGYKIGRLEDYLGTGPSHPMFDR
jgi:peptidoglycan/xylan/chitin deacetylase (PgdA/CDA1 family)